MTNTANAVIAKKNRTRPQYEKNVLNIEPIIDIGFSASNESEIIPIRSDIGRKNAPAADNSQKIKSVRRVKI